MFNKEKKLDSILATFTKAITSLSSLQEEVADDLAIKQIKINKLEEECDKLIGVNKKTSMVMNNLSQIVGGNV